MKKQIEKHYQEYDIESDFQYFQKSKNEKSIVEEPFQLVKQPRVLEEIEFYEIMRIFNPEQAKIVK